jgi:hypothetical protein
MCDVPNCDEHYGCRLRHKGIQVSPRALPNRPKNWRPSRTLTPDTSLAKPVTISNGRGVEKPVWKSDGTMLLKGEYVQDRRKYDDLITKAHHAPSTS